MELPEIFVTYLQMKVCCTIYIVCMFGTFSSIAMHDLTIYDHCKKKIKTLITHCTVRTQRQYGTIICPTGLGTCSKSFSSPGPTVGVVECILYWSILNSKKFAFFLSSISTSIQVVLKLYQY